MAGSLAVMTDAAHLLTDLTSFIISLFSLWLSSKPATQKLSYGWHRAGIPAPINIPVCIYTEPHDAQELTLHGEIPPEFN